MEQSTYKKRIEELKKQGHLDYGDFEPLYLGEDEESIWSQIWPLVVVAVAIIVFGILYAHYHNFIIY